MTIADLQRLLPLPPNPRHNDPKTWPVTEANLDLQLPPEWKQFGELYGSGTIRHALERHSYIWIYNPLSPNFPERVRSVCDLQRQTEEFHGETFELHPFYPDDDGFFPLGEDDCENSFWFHMNGHPAGWQIVVWGGFGSGRVQAYSLTLIEFLNNFISGELPIPGYDGGFPDGVVFQSDKRT